MKGSGKKPGSASQPKQGGRAQKAKALGGETAGNPQEVRSYIYTFTMV